MANVTETTNRLIEEALQGGIEYAEAIRAVGEEIARMANEVAASRANEKQLDVVRGKSTARRERHIVDLIWAIAHELSRCPVISPSGSGAPVESPFVTIGNVLAMTAERALTGSASINVADGGANADVTLSVLPLGVDHDALSGFVAAEHVDHSAVSIIAGTALSGGGTLEADRTLNVVPGSISHADLANLTAPADDHSQYAMLAGRSTGQTLSGGTAASEALTLAGTSHPTPGNVVIASGSNLDLNGNEIYGATYIRGDDDVIVLSIVDSAGDDDYVYVQSAATGAFSGIGSGNVGIVGAAGADPNVELYLVPKGSGQVRFAKFGGTATGIVQSSDILECLDELRVTSGTITSSSSPLTITTDGTDIVKLKQGSVGGNIASIDYSALAASRTIFIPALGANDTLVFQAHTQTLTNKTITQPTLTLKQGAAAAPTAEGDIQWDTDDDKLKVGNGTSTETFTPDADGLNLVRQQSVFITGMSIPDSNGCEPITVEDASTDAVKYTGWSFDDSTDEYLDLFGYCGAGFDSSKDLEIVITAGKSAADANHGASFDAVLKKMVDSSTDLDALNVTGHTASDGALDLTLPATVHQFISGTITFSSHGLSAGDRFHMRLFRDVSDTNDNYPQDVYVYSWIKIQGGAT